jgi:hypothetical protein
MTDEFSPHNLLGVMKMDQRLSPGK